MIKLLLRIGLIRLRDDGSIRWPLRVDNWSWWKIYFKCLLRGEWFSGRPFTAFGVFHNLPGVIEWEPDRLLPRRWGIQLLGLEIGDRG